MAKIKIPKTFVPKKDLKKDMKKLIEKPQKKVNISELELLIESCGYYTERRKGLDPDDSYIVGLRTADKLTYDKHCLEELSKRATMDDVWLGIYFSALFNKIIKENEIITLELEKSLIGLGIYMKKGILVIEGDVKESVGGRMEGGEIYVKGNAGRGTGESMEGGEIHIERNVGIATGYKMIDGKIYIKGNAGDGTGEFMEGGEIHVDGDIYFIDPSCEGKIFNKGKQVWPQ